MLTYQDLVLHGFLMAMTVVSIRIAYTTYARYLAMAMAREAARLEKLPGRRR